MIYLPWKEQRSSSLQNISFHLKVKQAQESLGSCDELLSAKLFNLNGTIKKQHNDIISKIFVFFEEKY